MVIERMTQEWYNSFMDRAEREFKRAWEEMLFPNTNDALRALRRDLARYEDALKRERFMSLDSIAALFANFLAYQAPLLYSLRVELIGAPGTAAISERGELYIYACPFFDKTHEQNPLRGVLPDSKYEQSYFSDLLYGYGYSESEFKARMLKTLRVRDIELIHQPKPNDYRGTPVLWPDSEPIFDTAFLAALVIHELAHIGFSHFGYTAKVFKSKVLNLLRHSKDERVVEFRRELARSRRSMKRRLATLTDLELPDDIMKRVKSNQEAWAVHLLYNQATDAFIHGVLPIIEIITAEAMRRRYFPEGGDGGAGSKERVFGEMVDETDAQNKQDADESERESEKQSGDEAPRIKAERRVVQKGMAQREYMTKSIERQDSIFEGITRISKGIGNTGTDLIDAAQAALVKLRQDPFVKYSRAQRRLVSLFGKPATRSNNPRPDEVYLRRMGKIGYLPRMTKRPSTERMMVVVDTSGSMSPEDVSAAFGFIEATLAKYNYRFTVYVCDAEAHLICEDAHKLPKDIKVPCGGTNLSAAIHDAHERGILKRYSAFVFITDGLNNEWGTDIIKSVVSEPVVCIIQTTNDPIDNHLKELRESGIEYDVVPLSDIVESFTRP